MFEARGYRAFHCIRPLPNGDFRIEPRYRYDTVLYADAAGQERLPVSYRGTAVPDRAASRDFVARQMDDFPPDAAGNRYSMRW